MNYTYAELAVLNKMVIIASISKKEQIDEVDESIHKKIADEIIQGDIGDKIVDFTYAELARLNKIIGIALMYGKVEFDDVTESIHKKVADEII